MKTEQVQHQLNQIGYQREFTVIFTKTNGEQRKITGFLERPESGGPKNNSAVPVKVTKGDAAGQWRSFRVDSVLSLEIN